MIQNILTRGLIETTAAGKGRNLDIFVPTMLAGDTCGFVRSIKMKIWRFLKVLKPNT